LTEITEKENKYESMADEDIIDLSRNGDKYAIDYIIDKYKNLVRSRARTYFLIGADKEDIVQEGMIGLYKAARDFKKDKHSSFKAFAELCVTRQIITAIKSATRQKHIPLNSDISLNKPFFGEENEQTLLNTIGHKKNTNPEKSKQNAPSPQTGCKSTPKKKKIVKKPPSIMDLIDEYEDSSPKCDEKSSSAQQFMLDFDHPSGKGVMIDKQS